MASGGNILISMGAALMDLRKATETWRLYVITDEVLSQGRSHTEIAKAAVNGGADVIQLRDKTASTGKLYEAALEIRRLTKNNGVPFIVNDRLDIALATDADGVHVGQADLPASIARRILGPDKILGVSARSLEEAMQAEKDGADYLGVGPIFEARSSKPDAGEPAGLALIKSVRQSCQKPIVAIGGINHANAADVIRAGAHCISAISAVVSAEDIAKAAQTLKQIILTKGNFQA